MHAQTVSLLALPLIAAPTLVSATPAAPAVITVGKKGSGSFSGREVAN